MTPDQQHHIRNGAIVLQRILRWMLANCKQLKFGDLELLEQCFREAGRIEAACKPATQPKDTRTMTQKPGYKTTEFYLSLIPQLTGLLALTGAIAPEQANDIAHGATQAVGGAMMVFSAASYALSRARAKSGRGE